MSGTHQSGKREFQKQQVCSSLVPSDLAQGHCAGLVSLRFSLCKYQCVRMVHTDNAIIFELTQIQKVDGVIQLFIAQVCLVPCAPPLLLLLLCGVVFNVDFLFRGVVFPPVAGLLPVGCTPMPLRRETCCWLAIEMER